jgi:hypothetical protein
VLFQLANLIILGEQLVLLPFNDVRIITAQSGNNQLDLNASKISLISNKL